MIDLPLDASLGLRQKVTLGRVRLENGLTGTEEPLAALLAATASGDRVAFRHLYDRTSAKLFGVVLRLVRDRATAAEVLQESYLRVWQRSGSYAPAYGGAMSWLIALARHAAIDRLRGRRGAEVGLEAVAELAVSPDAGGDVLLRDRLAACLEALDGRAGEAVRLAYLEGWSREELAGRYGRPAATVKTWLRRALLSLRSCLERT